MAKQNLASLSVDALLRLRDDIGSVLSERANALKVAAKYRDPKSKMTWAGRGAQQVWMREAIKAGKKPDDFLISRPAKKTRRRKK